MSAGGCEDCGQSKTTRGNGAAQHTMSKRDGRSAAALPLGISDA